MASPRKRRKARAWHRWMGIIAALPLLWLAISGVLLNHAEFFGLNGKDVTATWLLRRYHQLPEGAARGVDWGGEESGVEVVEWDGLLFYEERLLEGGGVLVGGVPFREGAAVATEEFVYVVNAEGTVVDRLDETVLPGVPVEGVLLVEGRLAVQVGGRRFLFDEELLIAEEAEWEGVVLPVVELPVGEREKLEAALASVSGIPLSRVILDLHSGKLMGWPGWLITDLSAGSLVVLTLLGVRLFPKRKG
jgi:hypothetical protein